MVKHRGGWGKYAREHSAKVGDNVRYGGHLWTIWYQSGSKVQAELQKESSEKARAKWIDGLTPEMKIKHPQMAIEYIFRIQKTKRQTDYKQSDWYRVLKREKK